MPTTRHDERPTPPAPGHNRLQTARRRALRAETIGVVLLALLILIITVLRYGRSIPWGAR